MSLVWSYESDDGSEWKIYAPAETAILDAAFLQMQLGASHLFNHPSRPWQFDLKLMTQTNVNTQSSRGIRFEAAAKVYKTPVLCREKGKCTRPLCTFHHASPAAGYEHPKAILSMLRNPKCRYAAACTNANCSYSHSGPAFGGGGGAAAGAGAAAPIAAEAERQADLVGNSSAATNARCIVLNGIVYKSLADHDPHSTSAIDEHSKLYNLDPPWQLCPKTADALHVCATYPWASYALVFADGSAHYTALPQTLPGYPGSPYEPGAQANPWDSSFSGLRQQGGQYGTARDGCFDCGIPSHCGCIRRLDVLIMRNL